MANPGNVFHLYVEVRSVAEEEGEKLKNIEGVHSFMTHGPDVYPQSQHGAMNAPHGLVPPETNQHQVGNSPKGPSTCKSSSRHQVNLQIHPGKEEQTSSPHERNLTPNEIHHLLSALQLDLKEGKGSVTKTRSTESEPFGRRDFENYGHFTAPPTPSGARKAHGQISEGKQSIVTYKYIEKANIRSVGHNDSILCQNEPENLIGKALNDQTIPVHLSEKFGVPAGPNMHGMICNSNVKKTVTGSEINPQNTHQLNMLNSIAKNATHQPLEEFGSPQLRHHLATAIRPDRNYNTLHREQPRCHSWSGSPVVPRIAKTLPVNAYLKDPNHHSHLYGFPSSLAAQNISSDAEHPYTMSRSTKGPSQAISSQQVWKSDETLRKEYRHSPIFLISRPTAFHHQTPDKTVSQPHKQKLGQKTSESQPQVNFSLTSSSKQPSSNSSKLSGDKYESVLCVKKIKANIAGEATKLFNPSEDRKSSSPTQSLSDTLKSDSTKSGLQSTEELFSSTSSETSLVAHDPHWEKEPVETRYPTGFTHLHREGVMSTSATQQPQNERKIIQEKNSPVLYKHQPPNCAADKNIPGQDNRNYNGAYGSGLKESPDLIRRCRQFYSRIPTVSTSKHHWRESHFSRFAENANKENCDAEDSLVIMPSDVGKKTKPDSTVLKSRETHFITPAQKDIRVDGLTYGEQNSVLSQGSSKVKGSPVKVIQPERDSIFPVATSQNNLGSSGTVNTDIQSDSGSLLFGPSSHCQKIARAKWEFLFGKPVEDNHEVPVPDFSIASSDYTSKSSCKFTSSNSSERHDVQQVDIDPTVNTSPPSAQNSSTKSGIIRRSIKYSETDLDAVPLRCYRETDIDEVMLAEQEEIDSAISRRNGVVASSGTSSGSTFERLFCSQTSVKEEQLCDDEMVSWASVRRNCDKRRQQAGQDGDEVFSRLLESSKNCQLDSHPSILKSPITVGSPSRISTEGLDSFSRHFESIMESHRAKGTSFSSLDSVDMGFIGPPIFTFDFTTLTPEIQSQICESAKKIIDSSFATLGEPETSCILTPRTSEALTGATMGMSEKENELTDSVPAENRISSESTKVTMQRERATGLVLQSDHVVSQRLARGRNDNIPNDGKADLQTAKLLAKRLYNLDGFRRSDIARHLNKNNNFSRMVAEEYLSYFNLTGMSVDQALRVFLREFALIGETQERERVLFHFSRRYLQCNPNTIPNLVRCGRDFSVMEPFRYTKAPRSRSLRPLAFPDLLGKVQDGQNHPQTRKKKEKALYNSIKNEKLQWTIDEEDVCKSVSELADSRKDSASHTLRRITSGGAPLVSLVQQSNAQVYKKGFLVRKVHADPDGKRTPRGKRGWKTFYAILKGLVLYLQKSEYGAPKQLSDEDLKNAVSIHHSLAMKAADYSKRPNVFYLRTADWRVFLFQAPNAEQMQSWITRINTVAAMFSAPPFPAAIGSQKRFSRPLLPGSNTKLSQEEQVKSHEMHFRSVSSELQELRSVPREQKPKGREQEEAKQREEYLEFEKTRYGTYAMLLRTKIRMGESDLMAFEARLFNDGILHHTSSSTTLAHDTSHASASSCSSRSKKSSRSESQRHKPAVKHLECAPPPNLLSCSLCCGVKTTLLDVGIKGHLSTPEHCVHTKSGASREEHPAADED
ncbi:PH and SEC7 domain-containing protein 1 [Bagarius yarrelli]|uniref:PH and SEC7 domain-containing protein 1 n=1 Tax=Bagarius yarrelli TaxID=175774 RepID=A0A556TMJ9_BAGYA|nr:PH and SEC7 domain-containing protein 1 [Bagarius yarrelli]